MNQSCDTPNRFLNSEDDKDLDAGAGRKVNLLDCCAGSYTHVLPSSVKNPIGDLCAVTFPPPLSHVVSSAPGSTSLCFANILRAALSCSGSDADTLYKQKLRGIGK